MIAAQQIIPADRQKAMLFAIRWIKCLPHRIVSSINFPFAAQQMGFSMHGPKAFGYWSARSAANYGKSYKHLVVGRTYVVLKQFVDFDGSIHKQGERWKFMGYAFLPHDDGLSLFVSLDDAQEWHIRMHFDPEHQGQIDEGFEAYVCEIA